MAIAEDLCARTFSRHTLPEEVAAACPPPEWTVDLGAQLRLRGDFTRNQRLSDGSFAPGDDASQFLQRSRLSASLENTALGIALRAQGQWYGRWSDTGDRSDFDLYTAYIDWHDASGLGLPVTLRLGRQDFSYGSAFFLGHNDFYNGLSWDGLKATIAPWSDLHLDVIATTMAPLNGADPDILLTGIYASGVLSPTASLDGYFFYSEGGYSLFHREFEKADPGQEWFTLGVRLGGARSGFDAEFEPQFQWGSVENVAGDGHDVTRAYGGHIDLGYSFVLPWYPRVFAAYALGSGHDDIDSGRYGEFHGNVFNDSYLVGDTGVVADLSGVTVGTVHSSGMHVAVGGVSVHPADTFELSFDVHRFVAFDSPSGFSSDLGFELNLVATYHPSERVSVLAGLNRFCTGRFYEQAAGAGGDIQYAYLQTQIEIN